jgi:outer membrane biosynthesis protein TonB
VPTPPTPTAPPQPKPPAKPAPPLPLPPVPTPPPPEPSTTSQPNATTNPAPNTNALLNTLQKLRAEVKQQPPNARYNPNQGGAPEGGGSPQGNDTAALSASQRAAIGAYVRRCWTYDPGALNADKMQVMLMVTTDADGVARIVRFAPADRAKMDSDPVFQAFADRARRAVLDPTCANLPLPHHMLGKINVLSFRFSP